MNDSFWTDGAFLLSPTSAVALEIASELEDRSSRTARLATKKADDFSNFEQELVAGLNNST